MHADVPLILDSNNPDSSVVDLCTNSFERYIQVMAIFLRDNESNPLAAYNRRLKLTKDYLKKCKFPIFGKSSNTSGALLSVENAGFLVEDMNLLYKLKEDGISFLSLTWNGDNALASGANGSGGITNKGKEIIKMMNELGMALDISHLSHKAAMEGIELANNVLASHSALFSLNRHNRNIRDEALLFLKQKQGIIGLCFYPLFLGGENVKERLVNSVEYLISLGLENNIAIGTDFDGAEMSLELGKTAHISRLCKEFYGYGFKKSTIQAIFYENAIAFFNKMCENK